MRYEAFSNDNNRLENSLKSLEARVVSMQNDMMAMKEKKTESPATINNQPVSNHSNKTKLVQSMIDHN